MDIKKTLEQLGEEGIARLIATRWDYLLPEGLDARAAVYGFNPAQAHELRDELWKQGYLSRELPNEGYNALYFPLTEKGKALVQKYAEKFDFERRFASIMERERNGWR